MGNERKEKMKLGVALSGGGVKGAAHIGVLRALEENGIKPDCIGGTSSGSIVAVLYAMGYTVEEIHKLFDYFSKSVIEADPRHFVTSFKENKTLRITGLLSGENIEKAVKEACDYKKITTMKEIALPIVVPAVDSITGKEYIFTNHKGEGDCYMDEVSIAKAVRASSSFPAIYAPCRMGEHQFLDGGILDNVPTKEVRRLGADKVLSVTFPPSKKYMGSSIYSILLRSLDIMTNEIANENLKTSDYVLEVHTGKTKLLGIDKLDFCEQVGYEETIKHIDKIKSMLD